MERASWFHPPHVHKGPLTCADDLAGVSMVRKNLQYTPAIDDEPQRLGSSLGIIDINARDHAFLNVSHNISPGRRTPLLRHPRFRQVGEQIAKVVPIDDLTNYATIGENLRCR